MISDKELSAIRKRVGKAAKGPWKAFIEGRDMDCGSSFIRTQENDIELIGATEADYDIISNAGQDILKLLDEIERLRSEKAPICCGTENEGAVNTGMKRRKGKV